jgi:hypothetical protein
MEWGVGAYLELLRGIVAGVDGVLVRARVREELSAVDLDGREVQLAVGLLLVGAVLPLHDAAGALGRLGW